VSANYTEDNFVERLAIRLFTSMGWQTLNCFDEPAELGRENRSEVIFGKITLTPIDPSQAR